MPLSSAQFCLQQLSPTMVLMVRSCNCFAYNRRFGNICSTRLSEWENFITNGLEMTSFGLYQAILTMWMRYAHHRWTNKTISSPMTWRHQCFATFTWRFKLEEHVQRSLDSIVWLERSFDDLRHRLLSFKNFAMKVTEV